MSILGPFIDAASATRNWIEGMIASNEQAPNITTSDQQNTSYAPVGPGDPRYDEITAQVTTDAATLQAELQVAVNQQAELDKAKQARWLIVGGIAIVGLYWLFDNKKGKRK